MGTVAAQSAVGFEQLETVAEWVIRVDALVALGQLVVDYLGACPGELLDKSTQSGDEESGMRLDRWPEVLLDAQVDLDGVGLLRRPWSTIGSERQRVLAASAAVRSKVRMRLVWLAVSQMNCHS